MLCGHQCESCGKETLVIHKNECPVCWEKSGIRFQQRVGMTREEVEALVCALDTIGVNTLESITAQGFTGKLEDLNVIKASHLINRFILGNR